MAIEKKAGNNASPVISDLNDFDHSSGTLLERLIFNNRAVVVFICMLITAVLGYSASKLVLNASFEKMLPYKQPYIKNYFENKSELLGLGNNLRVAVETTKGTIYEQRYIELLKQINDDIFLMPGVDRGWMKSIWMPAVRWNTVTEEGFAGGAVMPDGFDGSPGKINQLKINVARADIIGSLVSDNFKSSIIVFALLDKDPETGQPLDYAEFSENIEKIREKYEKKGQGLIKIHVTGFAKMVGDLIEGLRMVMVFFLVAILIAGIIIFLAMRCVRSTVLLVFCSAMAVLWQLGIIRALGFDLDPYSILVPFLIFTIAVSHGMQKMNGIMQDIGRGTHKLVAARYTFRRLFLPGLTAIITDGFGFAVLMRIDIPVIRDLALTASVGVAVVIFTNLIFLPVLLSYTGVSQAAARRSLIVKEGRGEGGKKKESIWSFFNKFAEKQSYAVGALLTLVILAAGGIMIGSNVKIGDLDPGAPELRPDSRYNRDNAFVNANYALSSDQFAIIVKTPPEGCLEYDTQIETDRLVRDLREVRGVQSVAGVPDALRFINAGTYDGSPKWFSVPRNRAALNFSASTAINNTPDLFNNTASVMPAIAYLSDHKAETLERVVKAAEKFSADHSTEKLQFLLAAGSAGIAAATNIAVKRENRIMMIFVYLVVVILCFITFRNWRAVVVAVIPLVLTSILCEALMTMMGIGIKVATLPVIALGVGIGVDYALYLLSVQLSHMRAGLPLSEAYRRAVEFTGKVVGLVGITLAGAIITWAWSPIKFQADMGILLAFMFFYNMIGALVFIPALSRIFLGRTDKNGEIYLVGNGGMKR